MSTSQRPLSPHLQVYRWGWTMSLSILHRVTGLALSAGAVLLAFWLFALAGGPDSYEGARSFIQHWLGQVILVLWTLAFFYHLCNGVRHLCWDAGWGFELSSARRSAVVVLIASVLLTLGCWVWVLAGGNS